MGRFERSLHWVADLDDLEREGFGLVKWDHGCHIRPNSVYAAVTAFWKMERHSKAALAVIAGGQGSRLAGTAKGLLTFEGRSLLSRLLDLQSAFAEVLLVANEPAPYVAYSLRTVADVIPDRGSSFCSRRVRTSQTSSHSRSTDGSNRSWRSIAVQLQPHGGVLFLRTPPSAISFACFAPRFFRKKSSKQSTPGC